MQSYSFSHMPQISAPKSQAHYCFWAWESTLRFVLQQKGKTVEIKELTAVINLRRKKKVKKKKRKKRQELLKKKISTEWGQERHVPSLTSPIRKATTSEIGTKG